MFKKAIMVIAIILVALSFACATSGTYNLRYIYYRYVEKKVLLFFTDMDREHVPSKALDLSLGLDASDAQVYLVCTTNENENSTYYINLTFNPMQRTDTVTNVINRVDYYYKARVWSFGENPSALGTVDVSSEQNRTVKFVGATVSNGSTVEDFYYPISFSFSDFIEDYAEGSFVATVIAEVTAR